MKELPFVSGFGWFCFPNNFFVATVGVGRLGESMAESKDWKSLSLGVMFRRRRQDIAVESSFISLLP